MSFLMVRIEASALSVGQMNDKLSDSSNPHEGVQKLKNLLDAISSGAIDAQVDVAVRSSTQAITAEGGGEDESYDLS